MNKTTCEKNNCTWCVDACTTLEADCPRYCGDGVVQGCEQCDDGNMIGGDGCTNCLVDPGWTCDQSQPSICTRIKVSTVSSGGNPTKLGSGAIAGIVIGFAVGVAAALIVALLIVFRKKKKSVSSQIGSPESPAVQMDTFGQTSTFDATKSKFLDATQFPLKIETTVLKFGVEEGGRAQVDSPLSMVVSITSKKDKFHWKVSKLFNF